jgi:hypothetical protein
VAEHTAALIDDGFNHPGCNLRRAFQKKMMMQIFLSLAGFEPAA